MEHTTALREIAQLLVDEMVSQEGLSASLQEEISSFVEDVFRLTATVVPIKDLDSRADRKERFQIGRVVDFVDKFDALDLSKWMVAYGDGSSETGNDVLAMLRKSLEAFDYAQDKFGTFEAALRLWMDIDHKIDRLLRTAVVSKDDLEPIVQFLADSLSRLDPVTLRRYWSQIQDDVRIGYGERIIPYDDIFPPGFFGVPSDDEIARRISIYRILLRPRAIDRMVREGTIDAINILPGIAELLAYRETIDLTHTEVRIIDSIVRLLDAVGPGGSERLLRAVELDERSWLSRQRGHSRGARAAAKTDLRHATRIAQRLLVIVESARVGVGPIEQALLQYKYGFEVTLPGSLRRLPAPVSEIELQKELCKFLLERGYRAFGTKFGLHEIDLLAQASEMGPSFVVEMKVYRGKTLPTLATIRKNLVQLQSYVDVDWKGSRGVLVIFNLSNRVIRAPREWLQNQYWILPINLCSLTPSKRSTSLELSPGRAGELLDGVVL